MASPLPPHSGVSSRPESCMAASGTQSPLVFQPQTASKPNSKGHVLATYLLMHARLIHHACNCHVHKALHATKAVSLSENDNSCFKL